MVEYIDREEAIKAIKNQESAISFDFNQGLIAAMNAVSDIPQDKLYNIHEAACILADAFGDDCACNFNGNDEWLPFHCDFAETCCPEPVGVACWEQYLKHLNKRPQM